MKKHIKFIPVLLMIMSCSQGTSKNETSFKEEVVISNNENDTVKTSLNSDNKCLSEFVKFREYIYQGKKDSVRQYFTFPIKKDASNWWALALMGNDALYSKQNTSTFTEEDFDKYFDKLFYPEYVENLLKVKSKELFEKGYYETPYIVKKYNDEETDEIKISMRATYDKKTRILELSVCPEGYKDGKKTWDSGTVEYDFQYDENCNLKFYRLIIAG